MSLRAAGAGSAREGAAVVVAALSNIAQDLQLQPVVINTDALNSDFTRIMNAFVGLIAGRIFIILHL